MNPPAGPLMRTAVLVSGSGSNLQAIIDHAGAGHLPIELVAVISDRPGVHALQRASDAGIAAITLDYREAGGREEFGGRLGAALGRLNPALVVLAGFMRILPADLVDRYRGRMVNVHPSLLPKYPGLDTYRRVLASGDHWHGSTVHFVIPELDAGPGIIQYRVRIVRGDSAESLRARVQKGEHLIYPRAIGWMAAGRIEYRDGRVWRDGAPAHEPVVVDEDESPA